MRDLRVQPQADWQEKVHNFCMYPMALANGTFVEITRKYQFSQERQIHIICRLFMKLVAYTVLLPLAGVGVLAGRCSKSYDLASKQYAWKLTPLEQRTLDRALPLFPARGIAEIVCLAQTRIAGEHGVDSYENRHMAPFLAALSQNQELREELRNNSELVHCVGRLCDNTADFRRVCEILFSSDELLRSFIENAIYGKYNLWHELSEDDLWTIFNVPREVCRTGRGPSVDSKEIALFGVTMIGRLTRGKSEQFRHMVSGLLPLWNETCPWEKSSMYCRATAEDLANFFSLVSFEHTSDIFRDIPYNLPKEQREAIWRGFLGGRLVHLSDEALSDFYGWFSLEASKDKGDPAILAGLLYPRRLEGQLLAKAIESLSNNSCVTDAFIASLTVEQYLSIPADSEDPALLLRKDLPRKIRDKFKHLDQPAAAQ